MDLLCCRHLATSLEDVVVKDLHAVPAHLCVEVDWADVIAACSARSASSGSGLTAVAKPKIRGHGKHTYNIGLYECNAMDRN